MKLIILKMKKEKCLSSEGLVEKFPSPEELWVKTFIEKNEWSSKFDSINFDHLKGQGNQDIIKKLQLITLDAMANKQQKYF